MKINASETIVKERETIGMTEWVKNYESGQSEEACPERVHETE